MAPREGDGSDCATLVAVVMALELGVVRVGPKMSTGGGPVR
jgi:hypothetical protein